jgi:hypothetical protein
VLSRMRCEDGQTDQSHPSRFILHKNGRMAVVPTRFSHQNFMSQNLSLDCVTNLSRKKNC